MKSRLATAQPVRRHCQYLLPRVLVVGLVLAGTAPDRTCAETTEGDEEALFLQDLVFLDDMQQRLDRVNRGTRAFGNCFRGWARRYGGSARPVPYRERLAMLGDCAAVSSALRAQATSFQEEVESHRWSTRLRVVSQEMTAHLIETTLSCEQVLAAHKALQTGATGDQSTQRSAMQKANGFLARGNSHMKLADLHVKKATEALQAAVPSSGAAE